MSLYYFIINMFICSRSGTQKTGAVSFLCCRDIDVTAGALNISLYFPEQSVSLQPLSNHHHLSAAG